MKQILDSLVPCEENEVKATNQPVYVSGKRRTLANQVTHAVTQIGVSTFRDVRSSTAFLCHPVPMKGNQRFVDSQAICVDRFPGIARRDTYPEFLSRF